jgi:hypothetical protein
LYRSYFKDISANIDTLRSVDRTVSIVYELQVYVKE